MIAETTIAETTIAETTIAIVQQYSLQRILWRSSPSFTVTIIHRHNAATTKGMGMNTSSSLNDTVQEYVPWRKGIAWWVVLLQGLVLLGIGGYALWDTNGRRTIIFGLGIYLLAVGIGTIVSAMRGRSAGLSVFGLLAAGGGLVAGLSVSLLYLINAKQPLLPASSPLASR